MAGADFVLFWFCGSDEPVVNQDRLDQAEILDARKPSSNGPRRSIALADIGLLAERSAHRELVAHGVADCRGGGSQTRRNTIETLGGRLRKREQRSSGNQEGLGTTLTSFLVDSASRSNGMKSCCMHVLTSGANIVVSFDPPCSVMISPTHDAMVRASSHVKVARIVDTTAKDSIVGRDDGGSPSISDRTYVDVEPSICGPEDLLERDLTGSNPSRKAGSLHWGEHRMRPPSFKSSSGKQPHN